MLRPAKFISQYLTELKYTFSNEQFTDRWEEFMKFQSAWSI